MKTNPLRHIALLLILALQLTSALAQQVTNMGTDFWMVVLPNDSGGSDCNLYIYSEQAGTVSIRDFYGLVAQQNVGTMGFVHAVSTNPNNSFGFIDLHSIHITSTTPVAVFAYNIDPQPSSLDASLIMPTSALGTDYMIQSYPSVIEGHGCASNFSMVAVENNTTVDVTLTADDIAGHSAGNTVHQVLSQGQVIHFQTWEEHADFSGSTVHANRPIAVFEGNRTSSTNTVSIDHCYHQAIPISQLGNMYVTMPAMEHNDDLVRITTIHPCTTVQVIGDNTNLTHTFTNRGETWECHITEAVSISANENIAVAQWQPSRTVVGEGNDWGDMAFFPLPPVTNMANLFRFHGLPMDTRDNYQPHYYFNIVVPTSETSMVTMDGVPMTGFSDLSNSGYSYKQVQLPNADPVIISTTGTGAQVVAYGTDENFGGYCMLAGYTAHINNDSIIGPIDTTIHICPGQSATFGDHTYTTPGNYQVSYANSDGVLTIVNIHVVQYQTSDIDMEKTFCTGGSLIFEGHEIDEVGDYNFPSVDEHGCQIHVSLHVSERPTYYHEVDTTICDGDYVSFNNQTLFNGDHTSTFRSVDGCDSTVTLHIHLKHRSYTEIHDTLDESSYHFGNRILYSAGNYEQHLTNHHGCDSIVRLHLWAEPCAIWAPNAFTPTEETNNQFTIFGSSLLQADVWIFERGGDLVAHFDGLTESWDGTHNGTPCAAGSYVYRIVYRCSADSKYQHLKVGTVTLLR